MHPDRLLTAAGAGLRLRSDAAHHRAI